MVCHNVSASGDLDEAQCFLSLFLYSKFYSEVSKYKIQTFICLHKVLC